jgi:hypothetical protein
MKLNDVGEIIAVRRLSLLNDEGTPSEVRALLGKPTQSPGYSDYYCPYQIIGAGSETVRYMCGIDAFQALQLAIRSLGSELDVLNERLGGNLRWEGDEKGWLGFPAPQTVIRS